MEEAGGEAEEEEEAMEADKEAREAMATKEAMEATATRTVGEEDHGEGEEEEEGEDMETKEDMGTKEAGKEDTREEAKVETKEAGKEETKEADKEAGKEAAEGEQEEDQVDLKRQPGRSRPAPARTGMEMDAMSRTAPWSMAATMKLDQVKLVSVIIYIRVCSDWLIQGGSAGSSTKDQNMKPWGLARSEDRGTYWRTAGRDFNKMNGDNFMKHCLTIFYCNILILVIIL